MFLSRRLPGAPAGEKPAHSVFFTRGGPSVCRMARRGLLRLLSCFEILFKKKNEQKNPKDRRYVFAAKGPKGRFARGRWPRPGPRTGHVLPPPALAGPVASRERRARFAFRGLPRHRRGRAGSAREPGPRRGAGRPSPQAALARGPREGSGGPRSYTLVVECPWGKFVLLGPPPNVLNVCNGCMPVSVFGIMVMVLGVISGMSSGERRSVSV